AKWTNEYNQDSAVPDPYAQTNQVENVAQNTAVTTYERNVPGGFFGLNPNANRIFHQYATVDTQQRETSPPNLLVRVRRRLASSIEGLQDLISRKFPSLSPGNEDTHFTPLPITKQTPSASITGRTTCGIHLQVLRGKALEQAPPGNSGAISMPRMHCLSNNPNIPEDIGSSMVPPPITEDYYMMLEVEQVATLELIKQSYKRLALKLHPDRNAKSNATAAFQLLGRAYETLKDTSQRQAYDLIYPTLTRGPFSPQTTQKPCPPSASTPQTDALNEAAQIAALQKSKQERAARWQIQRNAFQSSISELWKFIHQLDQQIRILDNYFDAEAAMDAQKNSWTTWLWSSITNRAEDTEEEKERKDRERQEKRIEKDIKERRLVAKQSNLKKEQDLLRNTKEEIDAADRRDDERIQVIQFRIWARETRERQEKEKLERERMENIRKQQREQMEKSRREAAEAFKKQQAESRAAEQKRQEEETRKWWENLKSPPKKHHWEQQQAHPNPPKKSTRRAHTSTCVHNGWWPKVQGRTACPECSDIWIYLLQCPSCEMKVCPKCQAAVRRRMPRNSARTNRRVPPRVRTPSPNYFDYD
ncbi:MAG: hypothetical protein Q9169_007808, partial [Polycauliona sp. 2 TL-2023]